MPLLTVPLARADNHSVLRDKRTLTAEIIRPYKKIIYFIRNHTLEGKGARLSYGITIHIGNADLV